jgi:hypothetical protein
MRFEKIKNWAGQEFDPCVGQGFPDRIFVVDHKSKNGVRRQWAGYGL